MEDIINTITSNKVYLVFAIIIGIMLFLAIVKRLIKLLIVSIIILIIYIGYLSYTGQKIPQTREEIIDHGSEQFEKIKKTGQDTLKKVMDK